MSRLPYSEEDAKARELFRSWVSDLGLSTRVDGAGNLITRLPGRDPHAASVMTGSHLDTQPFGGRFDGIVGVIASLEILESMRSADYMPRKPIDVVVWAAEEGSGRFDLGLIGSRAMIGDLTPAHLEVRCHFTDRTLGDAMKEFGLDVDAIPQAELSPAAVSAVVELHIEQGPYLEEAGRPIGVVNKIAGNWRLPFTLRGRQSHSGATPMSYRRDALCAASEVILAAERAATGSDPPVVATSGYSHHDPSVIAIVPGRADMIIDVRSTDRDALNGVKNEILSAAVDICRRRKVTLETHPLWGVTPTEIDTAVSDVISGVTSDLEVLSMNMPSWAGHDSMMLGKRFPAGVVFVPSAGGISHAPAEFTSKENIGIGAVVLCETVVRLAGRP